MSPSDVNPTATADAARVSESAPAGMSAREVVLMLVGTLGAAIAYLVPMVFTLALKLDALEPGNQAALGIIIGVGSAVALVTAPLTGVLSDRTRTRWGRRRPYTLAGMVLGMGAIALMAFAPDMWLLGLGWVFANLGWGTTLGSIGNVQADRLRPEQRGKVGALVGVVTQVAPVTGILLVSPFAADVSFTMWLPAIVGLPLVLAFLVWVQDDDSRAMDVGAKLTVGALVRSYGFRPRLFPDFAWNWLGRFLFFAGIAFTSTYGTFFYSARLGIAVDAIAPTVALMSAVTTAVSAAGAIASGWLSDRLGRRRPFIALAVVVYAVGAVVSAAAYDLLVLIVGAVLCSLGVAVFLAVNQAMVLDVLPHRDTQAGRFMGITSFSQKIPSALAPLVAPIILAVGATSASNFALLYLCAGGLVLAGGLLIAWRVKAVR